MLGVEFMTDEWIEALDAAARGRATPDDDPLAALTFVLEQDVDGRAWRLVIDRGSLAVRWTTPDDAPADVRLTCTDEVARAIVTGERPALDAFMNGDLRVGGDVAALMANRPALETLGHLFAEVDTTSH